MEFAGKVLVKAYEKEVAENQKALERVYEFGSSL